LSISQSKRWFVFYTKPNFEKKVDSQCKDLDIESYLPIHTVIRKWSDRKKKVEVPLFPGYIFVLGNEKERLTALTTNGVVKCIMFKNEPATLRDAEIESIKRIIKSDKIIDTVSSLAIGTKVKIRTGPLEGIEGRLTEIKGSKVFSLILETINSSILVDVPQEEVDII
jgi:transcription termination/antitermination protein NusG